MYFVTEPEKAITALDDASRVVHGWKSPHEFNVKKKAKSSRGTIRATLKIGITIEEEQFEPGFL